MKYLNTCVAMLAAAFSVACYTASAQNTSAALAVNNNKAATPGHYVPWKPIKESDIANQRRVWEDITISEKKNDIFGKHKTGIGLADALINGVMDGKIMPYSAINDRFTNTLTAEEFSAIVAKNTTVTKFMIKEDSLFLNTGEVTVRILGIAPVSSAAGPDGVVKEQPLFWVYYPDCRVYLSQYMAAGSYSWDDIMERRNFSGKVTKVHDHYMNKQLQKK